MNKLYVVRDIVAEDVGNQVIVAKRDEVASRAFFDALANPNPASVMAQHPEDYELLCIGEMTSNGQLKPEGLATGGSIADWPPRVVATGKLFVSMRDAQRQEESK